jgi:SnoaL-like domain
MTSEFNIKALASQNASPADQIGVIDALHRFTWGLDAKDPVLLASAFSAKGVADFSPAAKRIGIQFPPLEGRDTIAGALSQFVSGLSTSHTVGNARVNVENDKAQLQALVEAQHLPKGDHSRHYLMKNAYTIALSRGGDRWLIDHLSIDNIWADGDLKVITGQ